MCGVMVARHIWDMEEEFDSHAWPQTNSSAFPNLTFWPIYALILSIEVILMPKMITVTCDVCGKQFERELKRYKQAQKEHSRMFCCDECFRHRDSVLCECTECGKEIWRRKSQIKRSKTGNVFCSRSCATAYHNKTIKCGEKNPNFIDGYATYRTKAMRVYPHKCAVCGWQEDERILEVHHIDENRHHNSDDNLIILCPICHKKITMHFYTLVRINNDEASIVAIDNNAS